MKKFLNKTTMAIVIALTMLLALVSGLFIANSSNKVAHAADSTTVTLTADTTSFSPGTEFTMTITISSTRANSIYNTIQFFIGPKKSSAAIDTSKNQYLTFSDFQGTDKFPGANNASGPSTPASSNRNSPLVISYAGAADDNVSTKDGDLVVATVKVKIAENAPLTGVSEDQLKYEIGVVEIASSGYVQYTDGMDKATEALIVVPLKFTLKAPSDVNDLKTLKVGQGEDNSQYQNIDLEDDSDELDSFAATVTVTDPSIDIGVFFECAEDGENAKITVQPGNKTGKSGDTVFVTVADVEANGNKIVITVKAENGDTKTYTVNVTVAGGMLVKLEVDDQTYGESEVPAKLTEVFESSKTEYTVVVPNDIKKAKITATVSTGHSESTDMPIAFTGTATSTVGSNATSGTAFIVTGIGEGDTLTITVEAPNGSTSTKKVYTITFELVDVDASLDRIEVRGQQKNTVFINNTAKAAEKSIYGYYRVVGEPNNESKISIYANSAKASILFDSTPFTMTTKSNVAVGDHTIKVVAEAGNFKEFKITLEKYLPLELIDDTDFEFIYEKEEVDDLGEEDPEMWIYSYYRRTYEEDGLVHGIDDVNFERLVIGQVATYMDIESFVENFKNPSNIKLYGIFDDSAELVYNLGTPTEDYEDDWNDPDMYAVGTGWYIEYVVEGKVEETVYISVLGDLDGDGLAMSSDISNIGEYIAGQRKFETAEFRLAGYLANNGELGSLDITNIGLMIKGTKQSSDYWYKA